METKDKVEIETPQNKETKLVGGDSETAQKVEGILSIEGLLKTSEYKDFMKNMITHLPELNALLNSQEEVIDIVKSFDAILRKCSDEQANMVLYVRHGFIQNDVILNIMFRDIDVTQGFFGVSGNAKQGEKIVMGRALKVQDVTDILIPNRAYFLDYLETLLKKVFELYLGKENVK